MSPLEIIIRTARGEQVLEVNPETGEVSTHGLKPVDPVDDEPDFTRMTFKTLSGKVFGAHNMGLNFPLPHISPRGLKTVEFLKSGQVILKQVVGDSTIPIELRMNGAYVIRVSDAHDNVVEITVNTGAAKTYDTKWDFLVDGAYCVNCRVKRV